MLPWQEMEYNTGNYVKESKKFLSIWISSWKFNNIRILQELSWWFVFQSFEIFSDKLYIPVTHVCQKVPDFETGPLLLFFSLFCFFYKCL